jgi:glutamine amidotransferase
MITIIDYGMGNTLSIKNMIGKAGGRAQITADPEKIAAAQAIVLPGVGNFGRAMELIHEGGFKAIIDAKVNEKVPVLGICLGMQLLLDHSEEGDSEGLGYIPGEVKRFTFADRQYKIPHMGWNLVQAAKANPLIPMEAEHQRFYFVHSYFAQCANEGDVLCKTEYGLEFHSAIQRDHITGVQFHPEKSHKFGLAFFRNYLKHYAL